MRGRRPTPTAVKKLHGNPGKRPLRDEPQPPEGSPDMPALLEGLAAETWHWLCKILAEMGILAESDIAVMTLYCATWGQWVEAIQQVKKFGPILAAKTGTPYLSPYLLLEGMLAKRLVQLAGELGLTAISRTRMQVSKPSPPSTGDSWFERTADGRPPAIALAAARDVPSATGP